jgi:hypothetical protein
VQAGGGAGDTVHLVLQHATPGVASTVTLSHTVAPDVDGHRVLRARGRRPAGAAAGHREPGRVVLRRGRRLEAAALTGGTHPCDVGFARDVVAVLATAARALESGCREPVEG